MRTEVWKSCIMAVISILSAIAIVSIMINDLTQNKFFTGIKKSLLICETFFFRGSTYFVQRTDEHGYKDIFHNFYHLFVFLFAVTTFCGLKTWQQMKRINKVESPRTPNVVFPDVSRINSDNSCTNLFKFVINYGFYKFGIEITLTVLLIVILVRLDIFAVPYIFWFILLTFRNREKVEISWMFASIFVLISIVAQSCLLILVSTFEECSPKPLGAAYGLRTLVLFLIKSLHSLYASPGVMTWDFVLLLLMSAQVCSCDSRPAADQMSSLNMFSLFSADGVQNGEIKRSFESLRRRWQQQINSE